MDIEPPKYLSEQEILEVFPQGRRIIPQKIREWKTERDAVIKEIKESLGLSQDRDEVTREVWTEWIKLFYGPKLDVIDRHLWRLRSLNARLHGENPSSNRITSAMIERAKTVSIESLADREIGRPGKLNRGLCPLHEERTPSFCIYPDNSFWCFGCGKGGDAITFAQLCFGQSFQEAVRFLAAKMA